MTNVATKWYYHQEDDCSFESPQAPAAAQLRIPRNLNMSTEKNLLGPTGIGRRRMSLGLESHSVNVQGTARGHPHSTSHGGGGAAQHVEVDGQAPSAGVARKSLSERLRLEHLALQHTADMSAFMERQQTYARKVAGALRQAEGVPSDCPALATQQAALVASTPPQGALESRQADIDRRRAKMAQNRTRPDDSGRYAGI